MDYRLGIDLGGTSAKIALVNSRKKIIREASVPTAGFPKPHEMVKRISDACALLMKGKRVRHLGIGVAGDIDPDRGVVRISPNLGWKNVPLKTLFKKYLRLDVLVENDANAAAWGLYHTQVSKKVKNLVVMTLGTGVGGGIILDGRLFRGATGSAGEIGHMNVNENGPLCNCGLRGCLETYVGGPHLVRKVKSGLKRGRPSKLQEIFKADPDEISPYAVSLAAGEGDAYAISIWKDAGHALGVAVGDLIYLLNPEMICFTGGIAQAKHLLLNPLWETLRQRPFKTPVKAVKIKVARNAANIGVIGAAFLAH